MPSIRRSAFPTGTVTFLFTDIEGSTRLVQRLRARYADLLVQHHRLLREATAAGGGVEVKTEGDSLFVVFGDPVAAVNAVVEAQRLLSEASWPEGAEVAVRMGLHTGEATLAGDEYVGFDINRAARIAAAAHGGQVVLSEAARQAVGDRLPPGTSLRDLGLHRLKDLDEPEHVLQLVIDGIRSDFPPLRSLSARFEVVPADVSSFVGRAAEIDEISRLLATTRALTLLGPGGSGKTRLALEIARRSREAYADGVAYVPLSSISDPRLVGSVVRQTLGFTEEVGRTSVETLIERIGALDLLIVLDNFEHVLEASREVGALLAGTQRATILVTSRAPLRIAGEQVYAVEPLGLPDAERVDDVATVSGSESVILFVERARQVDPRFVLGPANAALVAKVVMRLEGLPLAIELAASRTRLLPLDTILARLERRLDLLRGPSPDRDARQRTLRSAIDWSHDLLGRPERIVFRRLGAFMGGATLAALEDLVPALGDPGLSVLDALEALTDQSLIRADHSASVPRFGMLETIREYAIERLEAAGEADLMAAAHARWYLGLVAEVAPALTRGPEAADRIEADHDNVRTAFRWAIDRGQTELALQGAGDVWRFWHIRGHLREGLRICEEVLAMPGAGAFPGPRARALYALASLHYWSSDLEAARREYEAALASAREADAVAVEAEALYALGYVHAFAKEWDRTSDAFEQSGVLYDRIGDRLGKASAAYSRAFTHSIAGRWAEALPGLEQATADFDALGEDFWRYTSRLVLGRTLQRLGQLDSAEGFAREGLEGAVELGDATMRAMALRDLGAVAAMRGEYPRGLRLAGASRGLEDSVGAQAPDELVNILDPIDLARQSGMPEVDIDRLVGEGRSLSTDAALELARGPMNVR